MQINVLPNNAEEAKTYVYYYNDLNILNQFSFHPANRCLFEEDGVTLKSEHRKHVNTLKAEFRRDGEFNEAITINYRSNYITNGQHRLIAFKELLEEDGVIDDIMIAVLYKNIPEEEELQRIINTNRIQKSWGLENYAHSNVVTGSDSIKKIMDFAQDPSHTLCHKKDGRVNVRYTLPLIFGINCTSKFKVGKVEVSDEMLEKAHILHMEVEKMVDIWGYGQSGYIESLIQGWYDRRSEQTLQDVFNTVKFDKFLECMAEMKPDKFSKKGDWIDYFSHIITCVKMRTQAVAHAA